MKPLCPDCGTHHEKYQAHQFKTVSASAVDVARATNKQPAVVNTVVNAPEVVVNTVSDVVVNGSAKSSGEMRTKDRHRNTAERKVYVRAKMRESRARKRAARVSGGLP